MVTIRKNFAKIHTIVMLTRCIEIISLHLTEKRPQNRRFSPFFCVFLMHSSDQIRQNVKACMIRPLVKYSKIPKKRIFFVNIFFLKVKMDILFMSFFKKKDRILTSFSPAPFHLAGLKTLASKILLSQKKSEISICPNRGYVSASCARAHVIVC